MCKHEVRGFAFKSSSIGVLLIMSLAATMVSELAVAAAFETIARHMCEAILEDVHV